MTGYAPGDELLKFAPLCLLSISVRVNPVFFSIWGLAFHGSPDLADRLA